MFLKQSTAVVVNFGPFLSPTDGVTLQTGLVSAIDHATTGIFLSKNGGALAIRSQAVTASTYDAYGDYRVTLSTTDTNTLGSLRVMFAAAASCLPVWQDFHVLAANIYDSLIGGGDVLDISVIQLLGTAWLTPGVAGTPDVNAKQLGAALVTATTSVTIPAAATLATTAGAVGSVTGAVGSVTGLTASDVGAIKANTDNLPSAVKKNTARRLHFYMVLASDHVTPATGLTVAATRALDGAVLFTAATGAVTEVASGWYFIDAAAGDLNGDTVAWKMTAATADPCCFSILTEP